jgi:hypothetical protein
VLLLTYRLYIGLLESMYEKFAGCEAVSNIYLTAESDL